MEPVSLVVGAALLAAGFLAGRIGRRRPPAPPANPQPVCGCGHALSQHDTETNTCYAELRASFDRAELVRMAEQVERIKKIAPTRPHPLVPNEGPVRTALGPMAALIDHLRDAVSGRGKQDT